VKVAVVAAGAVPNPTTGGGALTQWTVIRWLVERGHDVTVCHLESGVFADPSGVSREERLAALEALGARVEAVAPAVRGPIPRGTAATRARRLVRPSDEELFPDLRQAPAVRAAVERVAPDAAWVYHFEALAASRGLAGVVPRFAAVGDPPHLPRLYHWRLRPTAHGAARLASTLAWQPRAARRLLRECERAGAFAAHHARELGVEYLRTPVPDTGRSGRREPAEPTVLLMGHLSGAVTIEGLRVFRKALPVLERAGVRVRVVGGHEPPAWLRESAAVELAGHREEAAEDFERAHVLVVPTSIPLGIRVRVITAWSLATPVVAHRANARGTPELAHGENALLAGSAEELAQETLRALGDAELRRRLGAGGRATYERAFAPAVAAAAIESRLASLAGVQV
jgi:glycosyltransferase involved in cell wall biosynthesis